MSEVCTEDLVLSLAATGMVLIFVWIGVIIGKDIITHPEILKAIEECEKELPRNQSCEVVITAKVKELTP